MDDLSITIVQADIVWEDIHRNLADFDGIINAIQEETRLIVLPEMFTTGFTLDSPMLAETMEGSAVAWMQRKAREKRADIVGTLMIKEGEHLFNRLVWAGANGKLHWYDKKHLFRYAGEANLFSPGTERLYVEVAGWKICPFICYDLRFPCWTRNLSNAYDLAIFVASWPAQRAVHWKTLLAARAIENQAYVVGVNRVGNDIYNSYSGDSRIIDPEGKVLFENGHGSMVKTMTLSHTFLTEYRNSFPFWMDADI